MAKFEVLTKEDAKKAWRDKKELQFIGWNTVLDCPDWVDRDRNVYICEPRDCDIYRIKPQPQLIRKPLADLPVLAGAMIVCPDGTYVGIRKIRPDGRLLYVKNELELHAQFLASGSYHYDRGTGPVPCWTEVDGDKLTTLQPGNANLAADNERTT